MRRLTSDCFEGASRRICWRRLEGGIILDDIGRAEFSGAGAALTHRAIAEFKRKAACAVQRRHTHVDGDGVVTFALQPVVCERDMRWVDDVLEQRVPAVGEIACVCGRIRVDTLEHPLGMCPGLASYGQAVLVPRPHPKH